MSCRATSKVQQTFLSSGRDPKAKCCWWKRTRWPTSHWKHIHSVNWWDKRETFWNVCILLHLAYNCTTHSAFSVLKWFLNRLYCCKPSSLLKHYITQWETWCRLEFSVSVFPFQVMLRAEVWTTLPTLPAQTRWAPTVTSQTNRSLCRNPITKSWYLPKTFRVHIS